MRFGLFGGASAPRTTGGDPGRGFWEYIETNVEAERLGFYSTFLVEHHFSGSGQVSAPLDVLGWVAARTRSIRVGTAVLVLPWHDPVLLAERAATLDVLSGGRLDFGVGKGYRHSEFAGFCMPPEEAQARVPTCCSTSSPPLRRSASGLICSRLSVRLASVPLMRWTSRSRATST